MDEMRWYPRPSTPCFICSGHASSAFLIRYGVSVKTTNGSQRKWYSSSCAVRMCAIVFYTATCCRLFICIHCICYFWIVGGLHSYGLLSVPYSLSPSKSLCTSHSCIIVQRIFGWTCCSYNDSERLSRKNFIPTEKGVDCLCSVCTSNFHLFMLLQVNWWTRTIWKEKNVLSETYLGGVGTFCWYLPCWHDSFSKYNI